MTVTYLLKVPTRPELFDEACAVMASIVPIVRQEDGCIRFDFYTAENDRSGIYGIEIWRDEAALKGHSKQPHMMSFREKLKPTMSGPLEPKRLFMLGG
jgi:quinol monooxygenase YgiN